MFTVQKMPIACDLSEDTFVHACSLLGVEPSPLVTLQCAISLMGPAIYLRGKFGVSVILVPHQMLVGGQEHWAATCGTSWIWSEGC